MNKFFRYIILTLIAVLFMISSTGVYLTIHYCSSEDITGLFFFTQLTEEPCEHHLHVNDENSCCSNTGENKTGEKSGIFSACALHDDSNCSIYDETPDCCSNTLLYISIEDDFVKTDHPAPQINYNLLQAVFGPDITEAAGNNDYFLITNKEPPPNLFGKELAFFNCMLLL